ncbi:GlsB/YeaQ/YmgE family stress response membrane protein [Kibdelosporangium philippinense]|uniref:GlsB/YeaQ/YmgE family stress response membrane protein n=1 Tax=Kibdelosporangium philippinense TaxID=211113 RepID=A0ABS8Z8F9_9PSEU|nr:GlsB/YeaQ/YmgE family stress response membrane protein [Kibdelosporangium philippinense]MCE7003354.1 GlsB/YeaQ/YmgE family stress response membrane protein [Kibdelosporangium philippinense]
MTIESIIGAIVIGLIIGALARLIMPGKQNIPIWLTIVVGIIAAFLGSLIAGWFGVRDTAGIDWIELLFQLGAAIILVGLVSGAMGRRGVNR